MAGRKGHGGIGCVATACVLGLMAGAAAAESWDLQAKLTSPEPAKNARFGTSVSLSGSLGVVGTSKRAAVYQDTGTAWVRRQTLTPSDPQVSSSRFGDAVAVSGDVIVVGAPDHSVFNDYNGGAYVFERTDQGWAESQKLLPGDALELDVFGLSVALSGTTVLVGSDQRAAGSPSYEYYGAVYVYRKVGDLWLLSAKLKPQGAAAGDDFGCAVAVCENIAVIGAKGMGSTGAAYVFQDAGDGWIQAARLTPTDGASYDDFGASVAISGTTVVVGSPTNDAAGTNAGAAYVYRYTPLVWQQIDRLAPSDADRADRFGASVAIDGTAIIVGAEAGGDGPVSSGSAYVFEETPEGWVETTEILPADGWYGDRFGACLALSAADVIIGAMEHDHVASNAGAAYIYGVPEPCSLCLLAAGALAMLRRRSETARRDGR